MKTTQLEKNIEYLIDELDSVLIDMIHIDFNDEKTNIQKIENDIKNIRKISSTPIDLHIISSYPSKYDDFLKENKIEYVTYQYENIKENFSINPVTETQYGIAITTNTNIKSFNDYMDDCDFILLMNFLRNF